MLHANGQKRDDIVKKRADWKETQKTLEIRQLIFLDEASINTGMTRLYGWGQKSDRVVEYVPDVRFERTSVISTVRLSGVNASATFEGSLNGDLFRLYVKYVLAPCLDVGDVLLLDNLSVHKGDGVFDPVFERGAFVWFLPAYSADLNPIELVWSKVKSVLRKLKARTVEELRVALGVALSVVTLGDIENWFRHDGYKTM